MRLTKRTVDVCTILLFGIMSIIAFQNFDYIEKASLRDLASHRSDKYQGSIEAIRSRRFLRVLTTQDSFNYFIFEGQQKGYEYDMVKAFVEHLNKELGIDDKNLQIKFEMIPVRWDQLFILLREGHGDLVAAGITKTDHRQEHVIFSDAYNKVTELLVHGPNIHIKSLADLAGLKVSVRKSSSYYNSLKTLNKRLRRKGIKPVKIDLVDESLTTETILELVSLGKYEASVADSHIAGIAAKVFGGLKLAKKWPLRQEGEISWAMNKEAKELAKKVNQFLPKYKKGSLLGNINLRNYYRNIERVKTRYLSITENKISPYDEHFKEFGSQYGWDWRLLAALAYQESRFKQDIENEWGAIGIMQVKQFVANEPYVNIPNIRTAKDNIHAGVKYLTWLRDTYFSSEEIGEKHRIRLSLAAYNAGPGRLRQARQKAKQMGRNPNKWFREVEHALLSMNKFEPINYVSAINRRTLAYAILSIPETEQALRKPATQSTENKE